MLARLARILTRGLREQMPHCFDGALAAQAVSESLAEEGVL